jgi:NTP pyrophosphatase (non-canonical NTP hydrolase)
MSKTVRYVNRFARAMEARLEANRHKGNRPGWMRDTVGGLFERLEEEMEELREAVDSFPRSREQKDEILREAADVANFAMMVADRCHALARKRR